jgi:hypothetical protein
MPSDRAGQPIEPGLGLRPDDDRLPALRCHPVSPAWTMRIASLVSMPTLAMSAALPDLLCGVESFWGMFVVMVVV